MKIIILIIMILISTSVFAEKGKTSVSINMGVSSGTGFGLAYSFTDSVRVKVAGLYYAGIFADDYTDFSVIGGGVSLDFKKLNDKKSSVYLFLGFNTLNMKDDYLYLLSSGLGLKKYVDDNMFWEMELGYAIYGEFGHSSNFTFPAASLNFGYEF